MRTYVSLFVASALICAAVYFGWPFELQKLNVLFSGLGFVALVGTLVLQQRSMLVQRTQFDEELNSQREALKLQRQQIDLQGQEIQFGRILDLVEAPVKRYWSFTNNQRSISRDSMLLLVAQHLAGLAWGISFIEEHTSPTDRKSVLAHVYEPIFIKWATGNNAELQPTTLLHLATVKKYYRL